MIASPNQSRFIQRLPLLYDHPFLPASPPEWRNAADIHPVSERSKRVSPPTAAPEHRTDCDTRQCPRAAGSRMSPRALNIGLAALLGMIAFGVYLRTLAVSITWGDG